MWSAERQGDVYVGRWSGRIDELHWEAFAEALKGGVAEAQGASELVLDLASVEYLSSRGLRALTLGKREADAAGLPLGVAYGVWALVMLVVLRRAIRTQPATDDLPVPA